MLPPRPWLAAAALTCSLALVACGSDGKADPEETGRRDRAVTVLRDYGLTRAEAARRAGEILVVQNGIWLTAAIFDHAHDIDQAMARSIARCEQIALA